MKRFAREAEEACINFGGKVCPFCYRENDPPTMTCEVDLSIYTRQRQCPECGGIREE